MLDIEQRFFVITRFNGEIHSAVEYGDHRRTRDLVQRGQAKRIPISPVMAMMGPQYLVRLAKAGRL